MNRQLIGKQRSKQRGDGFESLGARGGRKKGLGKGMGSGSRPGGGPRGEQGGGSRWEGGRKIGRWVGRG